MTTEGAVRPSPLACIECRRKHLKCNAQSPTCSRCSWKGLKCSYTPSRRGCVGRARKRPALDDGLSGSREDTQSSIANLETPSLSSNMPAVEGIPAAGQSSPDALFTTIRNGQSTPERTSLPAHVRTSLAAHEAHLANLFYTRFYPAHPLLVPRTHLSEHTYPEFLRLVIYLIGSHYAPLVPSGPFKTAARNALEDSVEPSFHLVQALLLYAIVLHAQNELREACVALNRAIDHALKLGLNQADSACYHESRDPVVEESKRRTWWELYITDGYFAALHRRPSFRCNMVASSTLLPCEDSAFAQGIIPLDSASLERFQERLFADEEIQFPSFCYRIEAVRILARVLALAGSSEASPDGVQAVDNAVASWKHHLPESKASIIDDFGELDQTMFQAQMLINFASILLHFPRSELPLTFPNVSEIACSTDITPVSSTSNQHAVKAIAASKEISNLAALPVEQYSPFFICGLVFGCMVQLSACSAHAGNCFDQHRDRVALMTGLLRSLGRNWETASCALTRLKPVANEIFHPRKDFRDPSQTSSHDSGVDVSGLPSELSDLNWFDLFQGMQDQGMHGRGLDENELLVYSGTPIL